MNILLLGSGGREHAFAHKISQSPSCTKLFIAPGNAGTALCGANIKMPISDFEAIKTFCLENSIDLLVPGSEEPLVKGIYDFFKNDEQLKHIPVIGPSKEGAQLEGSKAYAKKFLIRHGIPTAHYEEFTTANFAQGIEYLKKVNLPIVLKADGLAAGKGVVICQTREEALAEFDQMINSAKFGAASAKVVVEDFLSGIEMSVFVITDGSSYKILPTAKDYKRIGEGDTGLNTGGMGAISPVPFATPELMEKIERTIIQPTMAGLQNEKIIYKGFLYFGLIICNQNPFVIEYNCRMGDPETEAVFPRMVNDFVEMFKAVGNETLSNIVIETDERAACTVVLVSGGYPEKYAVGKMITAGEIKGGSLIFYAGTEKDGLGNLVTSGGRVLAITSLHQDMKKALESSMSMLGQIEFEGKYFRRDIGLDVV